MLSLFAIAAAGIVAYGPPSNGEAAEAFKARLVHAARERGNYLLEAEMVEWPGYPSDVRLRSCVRKVSHGVTLENGLVKLYSGYECIVEVWPNGAPSFLTSGLFRHDGFDWVYYGPLSETNIPPLASFDPSPSVKGRTAKKPGAILYDGNPNNPINPEYNPYRDYFDATGWVQDDPGY